MLEDARYDDAGEAFMVGIKLSKADELPRDVFGIGADGKAYRIERASRTHANPTGWRLTEAYETAGPGEKRQDRPVAAKRNHLRRVK